MVEIGESHPKITTEHRAKLAYVYIRQSSLAQVTHHQESTDLQYQLVDRAEQLGWPREQVKIIDEDLGKSGASAEQRSGFQHLISEVGLGRVGLVLSFDASRLARNNYDWYRLLELCGIFASLIGDSERVYDPNLFTDRLLLGLTGLGILIYPDFGRLEAAPLGVLFMLGAGVSWAAGTVMLKRFTWSVPVIVLTGWQLSLGSLPVVAGALLFEPAIDPGALSLQVVLAMVYVVVFPMWFCHWAWYSVVDIFPASIAAIGTLCIPVIGVISSILVLDEAPGPDIKKR